MRGHTSKRKNNVIFPFWSSAVPSRKRVQNRKHIGEMQVHDCNKKSAPISSRSVQIWSRSDVTAMCGQHMLPLCADDWRHEMLSAKGPTRKNQQNTPDLMDQERRFWSWFFLARSPLDEPESSIFAKQRGKSFPLCVFDSEHVFSRVLRLTKMIK